MSHSPRGGGDSVYSSLTQLFLFPVELLPLLYRFCLIVVVRTQARKSDDVRCAKCWRYSVVDSTGICSNTQALHTFTRRLSDSNPCRCARRRRFYVSYRSPLTRLATYSPVTWINSEYFILGRSVMCFDMQREHCTADFIWSFPAIGMKRRSVVTFVRISVLCEITSLLTLNRPNRICWNSIKWH